MQYLLGKLCITDIFLAIYFKSTNRIYLLHYRVSQNFKHVKFTWDCADSYSLGKRAVEKYENYQIGPHLRTPIERHSFTS